MNEEEVVANYEAATAHEVAREEWKLIIAGSWRGNFGIAELESRRAQSLSNQCPNTDCKLPELREPAGMVSFHDTTSVIHRAKAEGKII